MKSLHRSFLSLILGAVFMALLMTPAAFAQGDPVGGDPPTLGDRIVAISTSIDYLEQFTNEIEVPDVNTIQSVEQFEDFRYVRIPQADNHTQYAQIRLHNLMTELDGIDAYLDTDPVERAKWSAASAEIRNRASNIEMRIGGFSDGINTAFAGLDMMHLFLGELGNLAQQIYAVNDAVRESMDDHGGLVNDIVRLIGQSHEGNYGCSIVYWYESEGGQQAVRRMLNDAEYAWSKFYDFNDGFERYRGSSWMLDLIIPGSDPLFELHELAQQYSYFTRTVVGFLGQAYQRCYDIDIEIPDFPDIPLDPL
jgi:hypothetical protein